MVMGRERSIWWVAVLGLMALVSSAWLMSTPMNANAHEFSLGTLKIDHPMARPTAPVAKNGAVFFTISDFDGPGDRLVSASTPQAARTEIHKTSIVNDVARMEKVDGVAIPAGDAVVFEPGGLHIMLMGLKGQLVEGDSFPLTLEFENAGTVEVDVKVEQYHAHDEEGDAHKGHH